MFLQGATEIVSLEIWVRRGRLWEGRGPPGRKEETWDISSQIFTDPQGSSIPWTLSQERTLQVQVLLLSFYYMLEVMH